MTPADSADLSILAIPLLALGVLATAGIMGSRLIRCATPAHLRLPRVGAAVLMAGWFTWVASALALIPLLVWVSARPVVLTDATAPHCERCQAIAGPFGRLVESGLPTSVLIALPAGSIAVIMAIIVARTLSRTVRARAAARELTAHAPIRIVQGHGVTVVPDQRSLAFAVPGAQGIVVSEGLLNTLDAHEITAVISHEEAHLRQHHHLVLAILHASIGPWGRIPLAAAILGAVPLYLEVAADRRAAQATSTTALASALLMLGAPLVPDGTTRVREPGVLLHAAGSERIRHLVNLPPGLRSIGAAVLSVLGSLVFASAAALIYLPYLQAVLAQCLR